VKKSDLLARIEALEVNLERSWGFLANIEELEKQVGLPGVKPTLQERLRYLESTYSNEQIKGDFQKIGDEFSAKLRTLRHRNEAVESLLSSIQKQLRELTQSHEHHYAVLVRHTEDIVKLKDKPKQKKATPCTKPTKATASNGRSKKRAKP
jgi:hypothetical protein